MSRQCSLCVHPARDEIDARLLDGKYGLQEIIDWLARDYPEDYVPVKSALSKHKTAHVQKALALGERRLSLVDGQIIDHTTGQALENVGIVAALRAIVTVGMANLLLDPSRVSVKDMIEALRLLKSLGSVSEEFEEIMDMLADTFNSPKRKEKVKKARQVIDVPVTAVDDPVIDGADPWGDLIDEPEA
jgi:hypothetical protein